MGRRAQSCRVAVARVFVVALAAPTVVAALGLPARAADPDPTTTTEPAPDTTTPDTTTPTPPATTVPDTTVTTAPSSPTSASPAPTTTGSPAGTTTPGPGGPPLLPAELLRPVPEFASLSAHQRALVDAVQRATDAYAVHRYAQVLLLRRSVAAEHELDTARDAERSAAGREAVDLTAAVTSDGSSPRRHRRQMPRRVVIHDRLDELHTIRPQLAAARSSTLRARATAQSLLEDLNARYQQESTAVTDALAARKAAESQLERELGPNAVRARPDGITATLVAAQAGQPDPGDLGGMRPPIPGAKLESPFGIRDDPLGGGAGFHPGLDLAGSAGTPILAAADGVVVMAGNCGGYGSCVVLDHGASTATLYGHQSALAVSLGQRVGAGEVIGYVGSTGLSTGPHLHFEVRVHGVPVDPLLALVPA